MRDETTEHLNNNLNALTRTSSYNVDMQWSRLIKTINKICLQNLNTTMDFKEKRWMKTETLELIEKRSLAKMNQQPIDNCKIQQKKDKTCEREMDQRIM
ncbi:hypothetical protein HHI36_024181 [Cryptolaemus montrouzieri]|uniref:Uncharacterized protein n=1 Tax=Cryptolaemus montrouzieri TaxID=559131 RepID=A0ABD2NYD6_9CUCU